MANQHCLTTSSMCKFGQGVKEKMAKFRLRKEKNCAAIILKITNEEEIVIEDELDDVTIEEVSEELPERAPRFIAYSYVKQFGDGRVSFPQCFIYFTPSGCPTRQNLLYSGSRNFAVEKLGFTRVYEVRDKEELTEDWLKGLQN